MSLKSLPVVCRVCGEVISRQLELRIVLRKWPPVVALHEACLKEAQRGLYGVHQYGITPIIINRRRVHLLLWALISAILGVGAVGAVLEKSLAPILATLPLVILLVIPAIYARSLARRVPD